MQRRADTHAILAIPLLLAIVIADVVTKVFAVQSLSLYQPRPVFGDAVRFTLVYNPGAAFGLSLGPHSRWIFMVLTIGALVILWRLYKQTTPRHTSRIVAISMVAAGAIGNLIDRVRSPLGVVDFIDVGVPAYRWPTFNIADMAVSCGAILLAYVLWSEENRAERAARAAVAAPADGTNST